jgi:hypothetical protein
MEAPLDESHMEDVMRKVIASPFISLDGFIAGPQGHADWGSGSKPPFTNLKKPVKLTLLEATPLFQGIVVLHYQRA